MNFPKFKKKKDIEKVLSSVNENETLEPQLDSKEEKKDNIENVEINESKDFSEDIPKTKKNKSDKNNKFIHTIVTVLLTLFICIIVFAIFNIFTSDSKEIAPANTPVLNVETSQNINVEPLINDAKDMMNSAVEEIEQQVDTPAFHIKEDNQSENNSGINQYNNTALNISFDYPTEWIENMTFPLRQTPEHVTDVVMVSQPLENQVLDNMSIVIESTPVSLTSKKYIEETEKRLSAVYPQFQKISSSEITVSGREATARMYLWVPSDEIEKSPYEQEWKRIQSYQVYISGKNKIYLVTFTSSDEDFTNNFEKYQKVLNTLKLGD